MFGNFNHGTTDNLAVQVILKEISDLIQRNFMMDDFLDVCRTKIAGEPLPDLFS